MHRLDSLIEFLRNFERSGRTGTIRLFRPPGYNLWEVHIEEPIKLKEMNDNQKFAFLEIFDQFDFERAEIHRSKDTGDPDRIKVYIAVE